MGKVSVIIPCYNVELYIEKCLHSIMKQTYKNVEIICINDGSTDGTLNVLNRIAEKDSRVIVISQQNKGLSETRNVGIAQSTGELIMFVDGDDWLETECIEKCISDDFDLICFSYNRIFRNKIEPRLLNLDGFFTVEEIQRRITGLIGIELREPEQANSLVTAWGKIYNTSIIKNNLISFVSTQKIGTEDALFNLQYLDFCSGKVKVIDLPFYNYLRYNSISLTSTYKPKLFTQWLTLHKMIGNITSGKSTEFNMALQNRIALSIIGLGLNEAENKKGWVAQKHNLSQILNHPLYIQAYRQLDYQYLPLHWKVIFLMAKYRMSWAVCLMMNLISWLWKRKNK